MEEQLNNVPQIKVSYINENRSEKKILTSRDAFEVFRDDMDNGVIDLKEEMRVIYCDTAGHLLVVYNLGQGSVNACVIDIRHLIIIALKVNALRIILGHNHPSQNMKPSRQDIILHKKVKALCEVHDITLLDNIIFSRNKYFSFSDEGLH